ncbi:MAG: FAD-dependent oxidoreductase, partial [Pseudomonadota bacterium]
MIKTEIAIIGGGVMGVSLLFHLTELGITNAVLLEKNDLTHGSTWHAAGLCTHFAHNPTIQALRAHSVRLYSKELPQRTGQSCGFHSSGAMRVTRNPDRMDEFKHVAGLSSFTGYQLDIIDPQDIQRLYPLATTDGLLGGIYEPDDGHVDPTLATQAMAQLAVAAGATIKRQCAVTSVDKKSDHWALHTDTGTVQATHIVNAAGTWGFEVGQMMGVNVPSVPVLHQYLVTESVPAITSRMAEGLCELPIIRDPEESWYVRQERDGLIVGPYERDAQVWSVDKVPDAFGAELLPPDLNRVEHILEGAMQRIPALADAGIKTVVNGPITFTPDANPLIGPAAEVEGAWLLTGSSMGVMEGGGAGWFLAHWMVNGAPPMDAQAVDPRRFGPWADRHYRIDKAVECFGLQFGVHYPYEERPAARDKKHSPLHQSMLSGGAVMGVVNGWERPLYFNGHANENHALTFGKPAWHDNVASEVSTLCAGVSLADQSALSKFFITGSDTVRFIDSLGANRAPGIARVSLTHVLSVSGGVVSEFTVSMLTTEKAYLTSAAFSERIDHDALLKHATH